MNSKALLGLSLDGLGMFQLSLGQTEKAIENLESALEIAQEVLGNNDEQVKREIACRKHLIKMIFIILYIFLVQNHDI